MQSFSFRNPLIFPQLRLLPATQQEELFKYDIGLKLGHAYGISVNEFSERDELILERLCSERICERS